MSRRISQQAFLRAQRLIPGGVNSPARAFGAVGGEPVFFERGEACYLFDVDGNRYIDYVASWGPLILGHVHPRVVEALKKAASLGSSFGAPTEAESESTKVSVWHALARVPEDCRRRIMKLFNSKRYNAVDRVPPRANIVNP